jgi:hypothetical protein
MKHWILALLIVCSVNASAVGTSSIITPSPLGAVVLAIRSYLKEQTQAYYIQVESRAENFEKAKQQAFRLASEQVAGTVVLSESELRNSKLTRDEIITYSSGLIDEYRIVSRDDGPNSVRLVVDIWIVESVMAQRLLARSATEKGINGADLATRTDSILEERRRGDAIFQAVLRDFPSRAFVVKMSQPQIIMDLNRNTVIFSDIEIVWDKRYLAAFYDASQKTGRKPCVWSCPPGPRFYIQGWEFDDIQKLQMIDSYISGANLHVKLEVQNFQGQNIKQHCWPLGSLQSLRMYGFGGNQLSLFQTPYQTRVQTELGQNTAVMSTIQNIRIEIVNGAKCR